MPLRRIAIIAPSRSAIAEPFSGGLAAHVWALTAGLVERGHDVTLFAAPGSDPLLPVRELDLAGLRLSEDARQDVSMPADVVIREHHAYLKLMLELADVDFDVIHNHSLHYLPVAMAAAVSTPMVTTLHTPPTPWLESAVQAAGLATLSRAMRFVAVSGYTARRWRPVLSDVDVIPNGVDLRRWPMGTGGGPAVWTGRIVPEKAPHLAVQAARRAGRPLTLAGPVGDPHYFRTVVAPLLGPDVRYAGHLDQAALARLVGAASVAVVTPMWDEPYGLVIAEALACGTPVAGFARGGVPEVVDPGCARLVTGGNTAALADAIRDAELLPRHRARARAESHCSIESMISGYESYLGLAVAA